MSCNTKTIPLSGLSDYFPGKGCRCSAHDEGECGCNVDWTPRIQKIVECWRKMSGSEMRLHCGEMSAQEVRTVKAVLGSILSASSCRDLPVENGDKK